MPRYSWAAPNQQGKPQIDIAQCPMPISYALPRLSGTISKSMAASMSGQWPPKRWKSLDSDDVPDGSFHGGAGGSDDVPPMRHNWAAPNQQGNPQIDIAQCPMPISYASPRLSGTISKSMAASMSGQWPPKRWKSLDSGDVPDGSFHGGAGGSGDVPPMWQSPSNAWQKYGSVPKSAPTVSQVRRGGPTMDQASSFAWTNATHYYGVPDYGFGIPMRPPAARGVPPAGHASSYAWSIPPEYTLPDFGFGVPDAGFGIPSFGYSTVPDSGFGVHKTPPSTSGVHNFERQAPASTETGMQQAPWKPKAAAASGSRAAKKDRVADLLEGFVVQEEIRKGGKSVGHKDKYYIHIETGKKFRSLKEVERFKMTCVADMGQPLQQTDPLSMGAASVEEESAADAEGGSVAGGEGDIAAGVDGQSAAVGGENTTGGEGDSASGGVSP